jgi:L-asparaginase
MNSPKIRLLITGGTIDDVDYEQEEHAPIDHATFVPSLLRQSRVRLPYEYEIILQKDSRFITEEDRKLILEKCQSSPEDHILITHGTYTMAKTAKELGAAKLKKTIVLFGSIIPINESKSDALFNLGSAFMCAQLLPHGVYIISNGNIFSWENVRKNEAGKYFEEEFPD